MFVLILGCKDKDAVCSNKDISGKWEVKEMMSLESVLYAKKNDYNPLIEFKTDGTYIIQLDVNTCCGGYIFDNENRIELTSAGCTKICCDSDFSTKFVQMLPEISSCSFDKSTLKLRISGWGWYELKFVSD